MFNIAIIEDDLVLRKALSDHFANSTRIDCVLAVETVEKFVKFHRDFLKIDLVLLDVMLFKQSSIPGIPLIQQREPHAEIVMYTMMDDSETIFQALCNGATGYLLKDNDFNQLEAQIISNLSGEGALLNPSVAKKIINYFTPRSQELNSTEQDAELSEKEAIVVKLLRDGSSYQEIAQYLGITLNGVRYHIKNVYRKLQIKSKGELWKRAR
jgi:DNA-binding NarL/FixJ family response regulator